MVSVCIGEHDTGAARKFTEDDLGAMHQVVVTQMLARQDGSIYDLNR